MKKKKVKVNNVSEKITESTKNSGYTVFIPESVKKKAIKPKKVVKPRKNKVEKPYNAGTFSTAAFWNFIRQALRKRTLVWKPIQNARKAAKRPYVGDNKRRSVAYECSNCHLLFASDEISVHHKISAGKLTCKEDAGNFIMNLFCEEENLCVLCKDCHNKHHREENN